MNFSELINYSTDRCWNGKGGTTVIRKPMEVSHPSQLLWNLGAILHVGHADCAKHKIWRLCKDLSLRLCVQNLNLRRSWSWSCCCCWHRQNRAATNTHYFIESNRWQLKIAILGGAVYQQLCTHHLIHQCFSCIMIDCWDHKVVVGAP